jgi:hypothetical protein
LQVAKRKASWKTQFFWWKQDFEHSCIACWCVEGYIQVVVIIIIIIITILYGNCQGTLDLSSPQEREQQGG